MQQWITGTGVFMFPFKKKCVKNYVPLIYISSLYFPRDLDLDLQSVFTFAHGPYLVPR